MSFARVLDWYCKVHMSSLQECTLYSSLLVRSTHLNVCLDAAYKNSCLLTAVSIAERQGKLPDLAFPLFQFYLFGLYIGSGKHKISFFEMFQNFNKDLYFVRFTSHACYSHEYFFFYHKIFLLQLNFSRRNTPFHITPVILVVLKAVYSCLDFYTAQICLKEVKFHRTGQL
jgi:hypothetical protein